MIIEETLLIMHDGNGKIWIHFTLRTLVCNDLANASSVYCHEHLHHFAMLYGADNNQGRFAGMTYHQYCHSMRSAQEWRDELCLLILARRFNIEIVIYQSTHLFNT